ncbi:glucose PTS transporter transcription antiterminator GlcT [Paenibacillus bovis]|uniref:PtsGHI operon antiterminator n=1 Tax=Paenibacillus bovis TaxID=1616788 RepID=A0A172ZKP3_9BACL|nr:PRD domain-containing protein [Paenibacillus bovis]ANF97982.1 PtsGHI operon antiterminator [Paenibacillus bovis]
MSSLQVAKVLNNNVIIADHPQYEEVVVIGKGIGFNRKTRDQIPLNVVEKMFILTNQQEQEQYKQLAAQIDEQIIEVINEIIHFINKESKTPLNEHIHIALTDHIAFAIKRAEQGMTVQNPFLYETREMYPNEYRLAEHALEMIKNKLGVSLEEDEIGFVALHIYSALTDQHITQIKAHSRLIADMVKVVEDSLNITITGDSLDYSRLLTHLRFAIERIRRGEKVAATHRLEEMLKIEYPEVYSLAWKLTKMMERRLRRPVYGAEVSYLTMHLQRFVEKNETEN